MNGGPFGQTFHWLTLVKLSAPFEFSLDSSDYRIPHRDNSFRRFPGGFCRRHEIQGFSQRVELGLEVANEFLPCLAVMWSEGDDSRAEDEKDQDNRDQDDPRGTDGGEFVDRVATDPVERVKCLGRRAESYEVLPQFRRFGLELSGGKGKFPHRLRADPAVDCEPLKPLELLHPRLSSWPEVPVGLKLTQGRRGIVQQLLELLHLRPLRAQREDFRSLTYRNCHSFP